MTSSDIVRDIELTKTWNEKIWEVTTMTDQVFKIVAFNSTEALEVYFESFPNEKEIKALNVIECVYGKAGLKRWKQSETYKQAIKQ